MSSSFEELREISRLTRTPSQEQAGREALIRFLDRYDGNNEQLIVDSLCARFGLYPYMSSDPHLGVLEALALELHSPIELEPEGFAFHARQAEVFRRLSDGENVLLSAPTSFGKSAIMDAVVASGRWDNIVIIVPTIALIDETRRRLARFREMYRLITHADERHAGRNIFVLTQERFLEVPKLPSIDFFMIDEFYKLSPTNSSDRRSMLLNIAWKKLKETGAQYYLTGPNVDFLDERLPLELRESLMRTDFQTVAVNVEDRSNVTNKSADVCRVVAEGLSGSTLIFVASPNKAQKLVSELLPETSSMSIRASQVAQWLAENFDKEWSVAKALSEGRAVHYGPLSRGIQRLMVRLFNEGHVRVMVCTSTLIEGVNTAAQNVVIVDHKIDGQLIDFFTFSNIRGRAGRMSKHFVGNVVTYMQLPEVTLTEIDFPIETQSDLASDAILVQLDQDRLTEDSVARVSEIHGQELLSIETIRKNRGVDPHLQIAAASSVRSTNNSLMWTGRPDPSAAKKTLQFAFKHLLESSERSGMNEVMLWGRLQSARANARDFTAQVDRHLKYFPKLTRGAAIVEVLKFQRNWMGFKIPAMLRTLQNIVNEVLGFGSANYEYLVREIEGLYLPAGIVELEEYGLPTPVALRLVDLGMRTNSAETAVDAFLQVVSKNEVRAALSDVENWIVDDVVVGVLGKLERSD